MSVPTSLPASLRQGKRSWPPMFTAVWLLFKHAITETFICLDFFLTEIQKLNCFANKARKANPRVVGEP